MSKVLKRLRKHGIDNSSALVIGQAFGYLHELHNVFDTVFVISEIFDQPKFKNFIYRKDFENINDIGTISVILVDLESLDKLKLMSTYWPRYNPVILVEGNYPTDRPKFDYIYSWGYRCVDQLGFCHAWKKI
jgi:hypothetical protein